MDILAKIFEWIQKQPNWQSDAFRRIWENGTLSDSDIDDICVLVKLSCDIQVEKNIKAQTFNPPDSGDTDAQSIPVRLYAIKELKNVNALAENQELSFNPSGLTVIYGENGSGKSGYSRVLKRACYARTQGDRILPNAFKQNKNGKAASATFMWQIGYGDEIHTKEMPWIDGKDVLKEFKPFMSSVAVFDSQCARVYTEDKGRTVDYLPYGLDLLKTLGLACKDRIGKRLQNEITAIHQGLNALQSEVGTSNQYGKFIEDIIGGKINDKIGLGKAQDKPAFTPDDQRLLNKLEKDPKGRNSEKQAQDLRKKQDKMADLKSKIVDLTKTIDNFSNQIPNMIKGIEVAKEMVSAEAEKFTSNDLLPGTVKEEAWKKLYLAAQEFSVIAYPSLASRQGPIFPEDEPHPRCVLCQQPLAQKSIDHLINFDKFMRDKSEANLLDKQKNIETIRKELNQQQINMKQILLPFVSDLESLSEDAGDKFSGLLNSLKEYIGVLEDKVKQFIVALESHKWEGFPSSPANNPEQAIEELLDWIRGQILEHGKATAESINTQITELRAKKTFDEHRETMINLIRLEMCRKAVSTRKISFFEKTLSNEEVNQKLAERLNDEIENFGSPGAGKEITFHVTHREGGSKIQLELPRLVANCRPSDILSEGEQNAIAMASFFSEISLSDNVSTLVFDDPATSMDDGRLERIAERLIDAAKKKQVIVFTHDIYFANLLSKDKEAKEIGLSHKGEQEVQTFGIVGEMPFSGMNVDEKIQDLEHRGGNLENPQMEDKQKQTELKAAYFDLRHAIEHLIESIVLHRVLTRRSSKITTGNLPKIFFQPENKADAADIIDRLHTRVSNRLHGSERGVKLQVRDLKRDVKEFKEVRKKFKCSNSAQQGSRK